MTRNSLLGAVLGVMLAGMFAAAAPVSSELLQKATAISLGNMAWESVKLSEVRTEGSLVKWTADTPTGRWLCQATPEGKQPYCDRQREVPR